MVTYNPSVKGWNFPMQEAAENEQGKHCHERRLLNTVSPTVLQSKQSNPAFGWKVGKKKKIWQWSDCSLSTSNPTMSKPFMSCAGNRQTSALRSSSSGRPPQRQRGRDPLLPGDQDPPAGLPQRPFLAKEGDEQGSHSPVSFVQRIQSQQHGSASCFLSNHLPTTRKTTELCQESAIFWISK